MPGSGQDGALLRLIMETAPVAIVTADDRGAILSFSPAAERMFGYAEAEVLGRDLTCLMPRSQRSGHKACMARYLQTGERRLIGSGREVRAERKGGEVFVAELAVGELRERSRRIFTGFVRDVSDRVVAETRARELYRQLERAARIQMLGEISSAMAHEINQPLAAISNFAEAARRALVDPAADRDTLDGRLAAIAEQALRAGEIVRRMRRMVDRGRADIRREDINEIIEGAVRMGRATSEYHGPAIELDLTGGLPEVMADRIQIQQVLINLMNNAYEAVADDEHPLRISSDLSPARDRIRLRAGATASEIVVTVSDTGPGIAPDLLERIFEPLVTDKPAGLGVGLAVCRSIIAAHGGRIWAENGAEGAEFHFTLPVADTDPAAAPGPDRAGGAGG